MMVNHLAFQVSTGQTAAWWCRLSGIGRLPRPLCLRDISHRKWCYQPGPRPLPYTGARQHQGGSPAVLIWARIPPGHPTRYNPNCGIGGEEPDARSARLRQLLEPAVPAANTPLRRRLARVNDLGGRDGTGLRGRRQIRRNASPPRIGAVEHQDLTTWRRTVW